jgi:hypothetical protein
MSEADISKWQAYQSRITKPRELLIKAVSYVANKDAALDLGAGSLYDSELLLQEGFKEVVAVDQTPQFREISDTQGRFTYVEKQFSEYAFPENHFDLVSAQYTLPFVSPDEFGPLWLKVGEAIKEGGIFTGQFFGERDGWHKNADMIFHSIDTVRGLISDFEILVFEEKEYTEEAPRQKHWHYFDLIIRKKLFDDDSR